MSNKKRFTEKNRPKNRFIPATGMVVLLLVGVFGLFVFMQETQAGAPSLPREIPVARAYEMREAGAFILDVRTPQEYDEFHIPGVPLIPLNELPDRLNEVPRDQEVVIVCRSGNRSATARDILFSAGFENVTSMGGGMLQWQAAGYPTVSGQ
jgi:rhodanese-related sulfurtransferase